MEEDKVSIDWGGVRGAVWTGAGGILLDSAIKAIQTIMGRQGAPSDGPNAPVSREILDLKTENALLKANAHSDAMNAAQLAWNSKQEVRLDYQQREIDRLFSMTKLTIPNDNLTPGVGPMQVVPVPPPPPPPAPTPDVATITAAVIAAMNAQKSAAGGTGSGQ